MKLIFLHGLGQTPNDWQAVINDLSITSILNISLFSENSSADPVNLQTLNKKVTDIVDHLNEPYILCGLSLGAILSLQQAIRHKNQLKGIIVSAPQFEYPNKILMSIQNLVFRLMPNKTFQKMNLSKTQVIHLMESIKEFQLADDLGDVSIPVLILCGTKDVVNLPAAKKLSQIMKQSHLELLSGGGHQLNKDLPKQFAEAVDVFCRNIEKSDHNKGTG